MSVVSENHSRLYRLRAYAHELCRNIRNEIPISYSSLARVLALFFFSTLDNTEPEDDELDFTRVIMFYRLEI